MNAKKLDAARVGPWERTALKVLTPSPLDKPRRLRTFVRDSTLIGADCHGLVSSISFPVSKETSPRAIVCEGIAVIVVGNKKVISRV